MGQCVAFLAIVPKSLGMGGYGDESSGLGVQGPRFGDCGDNGAGMTMKIYIVEK